MKREQFRKEIMTIPNLLSCFRLMLILAIIYLYCMKEAYYAAAFVVVLSGITDIADGYIARHFHMISDLGKALDPVADKLTQLSVLLCLITQFPFMLLPFLLLLFKEIVSAVVGAVVIHRTQQVHGAVWHGKMTTVLLYAMMIIHLLFGNQLGIISPISILVCTGMMLISFALYSIRNVKLLCTKNIAG